MASGAPLNLSLLLRADAKGVTPATAEARREVASIGEAAKKAATDTRVLSAANDEATRAYVAATQAALGQSAAERELRAAINQRLGISRNVGQIGDPFAGNAARAADIAAYGRSLDILRAKYNPLYAEVQRYRTVQTEIRDANRLGAISTEEMTSALNRERVAALASIGALKGRRAAQQSAFGGGSFATANIAAQIQDIGVTSAMGMNPMQIALQQGTQLQLAMGGQGAAGAVKMLGAAFASLATPVGLGTIALVAATSAAIQYALNIHTKVPSVDAILERHEEHIRRLGPAYEDAIKKARSYTTQSADVVNALLVGDLEAATDKATQQVATALGQINAEITREAFQFAPAIQIASRFDPFKEQIALLRDGKIDVLAFAEAVRQIELKNPQYADAAKELREFTAEAQESALALSGITGEVDRVAHAFGMVHDAIAKFNPDDLGGRYGNVEKEVEKLEKRAKSGDLTIKSLNATIGAMSRMNPDLSGPLGEIQKLIASAIAAKAAIDGIANTTPKTSRLGAMDALQADFDQQMQMALRMGDLPEKLGMGKLDKSTGREANAYRDLIKSANDRIDQMKLEIELVGKTGAQTEALRFEQQMLADAMNKGRTIGREQRLEIHALAEQYGALTETLAKARLQQDLLFDRRQLSRTPVDQQIASTLRGAGLNADLSSYEAGLIRTNIQLASARELTRDLVSGGLTDLRQALKDGKLEWEEVGDIAINALNKIIDKLQNDFVDSLSALGGGASGSGGGGILSLIGQFLGIGSGSPGGINYFPPAPKLAGGGLPWLHSGGTMDNGRLIGFGPNTRVQNGFLKAHSGFGPRDFKAILEEGETVLTARDTSRSMRVMEAAAGNAANSNDSRHAGPAKLDITVHVEGANGDQHVIELVQKGVSKALGEYHRATQNLRENGGQG